ncbi:MAG TPA: hypothetical protein VGS08_01175 [Candidatus Saccharimonadales bacterium]|nr:hypothetical protein [Candidatus Saccharimonadales bacterium]
MANRKIPKGNANKKTGKVRRWLNQNIRMITIVVFVCGFGAVGVYFLRYSHAQGTRISTWDTAPLCWYPNTNTCDVYPPYSIAKGTYSVLGQIKCDGPNTVGTDGNGAYVNHYWLELAWHPVTVPATGPYTAQYYSWINAVHASAGANYAPVPGVGIWPANGPMCTTEQFRN